MKKIEMLGKKFNSWLVIGEGGQSKNKKTMWKCMCDCGKISLVDGFPLRRGYSKSCGCIFTGKVENLTQKKIKELFDYKDGSLIRTAPARRTQVGHISGSNSNGYLVTKICGKTYPNHHLVWLWHMGYLPENQIDHIDRNRSNNRIENLREVSQSCNMRNCGNSIKNRSGVKGVCWDNQAGKWKASIRGNNREINLGVFADKVNAIAARLSAEQCLGYDSCDSNSPAAIYMAKYIGEVTI